MVQLIEYYPLCTHARSLLQCHEKACRCSYDALETERMHRCIEQARELLNKRRETYFTWEINGIALALFNQGVGFLSFEEISQRHDAQR
jgi:hypothetical protein